MPTETLQQVLARIAVKVDAQTMACDLDGYHWPDKPAMPDCPKCHGSGRVPNPAFAALREVFWEETGYFDCHECGSEHVTVDEDWCHTSCGVDATPVITGRVLRDVSDWPIGAFVGALEYGVEQAGWAFQDKFSTAKGCGCGVDRWDMEAALLALAAALPEVKP